MDQAIAKGESAVQDAIVAALAEYCYAERLRFRHTLPYSNQQGFKPGRVCADMAAVLSNNTLLILEVKAAATSAEKTVLGAFKKVEHQWKSYRFFEKELKVPVHYAFNTVETLAHATPAPFSPFMCVQTLSEIGLAKPSAVSSDGKVAEVACNLFQYIRSDKLRGSEDAAIALLGFLTAPLSNSTLVLAFAPDSGITALSAAQLGVLQRQMLETPQQIDANAFPAIAAYIQSFAVESSSTSKDEDEAKNTKKKGDELLEEFSLFVKEHFRGPRGSSKQPEAKQQPAKTIGAAKPGSKR
ncbi:hypothetical protein [Massilia haematophila]|uniref:Uncharacterized protein n=1 Tax=Massilia haematophila TaxID=457923 RepID=A0ABV7PJ71_9BURK|nr:hypothetical protein [Massilia sp.]